MVKIREGRFLFLLTTILFASHSSLALLTKQRSLLLCFSAVEDFVYDLLYSYFSLLLAEPVDATHVSAGAMALAVSVVLFFLPSGFHTLVSDTRLFSVLWASHCDFGQTNLAYHWSLKVDWDDRAFVS